MTYCMSDIHGEADRFHAMLEKIKFSDQDTLYILGDVIDRFPGGVDILREIMSAPNMVMLLGNHEQMCLDTLGPYPVYGSKALWKQNGGNITYRELLYMCDPVVRRRIINYLLKLPDHLDIEVNGRRFHLVHGFPSEDAAVRIWGRPDSEKFIPMDGCTVIVGHTPTCYMTGNHQEVFRIWHGDGIIDIDCGCGIRIENRRLACLRLDDMQEFYV